MKDKAYIVKNSLLLMRNRHINMTYFIVPALVNIYLTWRV